MNITITLINNFKKFIASSVINSFSDNLQTPFLPYVVGDSGSNKDENRLTDAGAFTVNIIIMKADLQKI